MCSQPNTSLVGHMVLIFGYSVLSTQLCCKCAENPSLFIVSLFEDSSSLSQLPKDLNQPCITKQTFSGVK